MSHGARPHIDGLTGIRAVAAAWVVIGHLSAPLFILLPGTQIASELIVAGYLGVEVFFILSGFIIAYTYAEKFRVFSWPTYRRFVLLRIARIYPVHLATLAAVVMLVVASTVLGLQLSVQDEYTPGNLLANVLMLQAVAPFTAWNGPAWSICAEFAAYLAFPVIALGVARIRSARAGLFAAGVILLVGTSLMVWIAATFGSAHTDYELIWLRISTEFTAGAALYGGWRHLGRLQTGPAWDWAVLLSILGIMATIWIVGGDSAMALATVPLIGLFVLGCASATGWVGTILQSRLLVWGGKVSYSVYMTHFILLMMIGKLLPWEPFADSSLALRLGLMAVYYAAIIAVGAGCYYLIEEPARHRIRQLGQKRAPRRVPATV